MDPSIIISYAWVILVLVLLEGLLAADNAIVMAVMVKHLPEKERKRALFYGLVGAFIFRLASLFMITLLVHIWQVQALGAAYLLFMSVKNLYAYFRKKHHPDDVHTPDIAEEQELPKGSGFWLTVLKVELADIAFAIDSMLAAIAIAVTLPEIGGQIGGINAGQFAVMFVGGMLGVILMRFAATYFVKVLEQYPGLEAAAFAIVGWIGIKLVVLVLAHDKIHILPHAFPHSWQWQVIFWAVLLGILAVGIITSRRHKTLS